MRLAHRIARLVGGDIHIRRKRQPEDMWHTLTWHLATLKPGQSLYGEHWETVKTVISNFAEESGAVLAVQGDRWELLHPGEVEIPEGV